MPVQSDSDDSEVDAEFPSVADSEDSEERIKPIHDAYYDDLSVISYRDVVESLNLRIDLSVKGDVYGQCGSDEKFLSGKSETSMVKQLLKDLKAWSAIVEDFRPGLATSACSPPAKIPRLSPAQEEAPPELVLSPGRRLMSKQSAELRPVRRARFCQAPACVYNSASPGQPARVDDSDYCRWCDPEIMARALSHGQMTGHVKKNLSKFKATSEEVYKAALAKLPGDFVETALEHPCQKPGCVFNKMGYGRPRLTTERFCIWCDEAALRKAVQDRYQAGVIRHNLHAWETSNPDVYDEALERLPVDFDVEDQMGLCQDSACVFSTKTIGSKARQKTGTAWCCWCDVSVVTARETTAYGRAQITKALRFFATDPAVLSAAWCKLSPEFKTIPQKIEELKRERHAMVTEDLVRECKGRMVPYKTEPPMCCLCHSAPTCNLRSEIKLYERIAAERAAASGEERVPIERDADWMRIRFALPLAPSGRYVAGRYIHARGEDWNKMSDCYPYICGCLWRSLPADCAQPLEPRCALCFDSLELELMNDDRNEKHYEHTGSCSTHKAPPALGYYLEAKTGFHVVLLLHKSAEISAMTSNDKFVDMSGPWEADRQLLSQQANMQRERDAMFAEDLVLFEKLFLCVQMDPVGGRRRDLPWKEDYRWGNPCLFMGMECQWQPWDDWIPFETLDAALAWLRAPTVHDHHIRKIYGGGRSRLLELLPGTGVLMKERQARKVAHPSYMPLTRCSGAEVHEIDKRKTWGYQSAAEMRGLGPQTLTLSGEHLVFWRQLSFPWVDMPGVLAKTIDWLRSRTAVLDAMRQAEAARENPLRRRARNDDGIQNTLAMAFQTGSDCSEDDDMRGL